MFLKRSLSLLMWFAFAAVALAGGRQEVARDVGAVLAWRLSPEAFEQYCRDIDPAGADQRRKALQSWLDKNATLIKAVDLRISQVIPLVRPSKEGEDVVQAVRAQVRAMLIEEFSLAGGRGMQGYRAAESDPRVARWTAMACAGAESLAALYDWQVGAGDEAASRAD